MSDKNEYPSIRDESRIGQHTSGTEDIKSLVALRLNLAEQAEYNASNVVEGAEQHLEESQTIRVQATNLRHYWERMMAKLEHPSAGAHGVARFSNPDGTVINMGDGSFMTTNASIPESQPSEPDDMLGDEIVREREEEHEVSLPSRYAQFALVAHPDISLDRMRELFLSIGQNMLWEIGDGGKVKVEPVEYWAYSVPSKMHTFTVWFNLPNSRNGTVSEADFLQGWHERFLDSMRDMPHVSSENIDDACRVVRSGAGRANVWDIVSRVTLPYGASPQEFREALTEAGNKILAEREDDQRKKLDR